MLALHKDLNLSRLVFGITLGLWTCHHVCDHLTFFVIAFLAQKNSRAVVNCRTLLNFEVYIDSFVNSLTGLKEVD